jgi:dTDP-4-dehydrorhamnose reductase
LPAAAKLVFTSSDYVFDGDHPPYREDSPRRPPSVYGRSKAEAEDLVLARPGSLIVRFPLLVGAGPTFEASGYIAQLAEIVRQQKPAAIDDIGIRYPTWIRDVAAAIDLLLKRDATGVYHLSGPRGGARLQWAREVAELLGKPAGHLHPSAAPVQHKAPRPRNSELATGKIRALGFGPFTDFREVCRDVFARFGLLPAR